MKIIDPENVIETFLKRLGDGPLGYNWKYLLTHPWILVGETYREIKWAVQRAFRGWDDSQTWDMDYAISELLIGMLTHFKKYNNGIPFSVMDDMHKELHDKPYEPWESQDTDTPEFTKIASDKWDKVLQEMIDGFSIYIRSQDKIWDIEEDKKAIKKMEQSLELFTKYYRDLWW